MFIRNIECKVMSSTNQAEKKNKARKSCQALANPDYGNFVLDLAPIEKCLGLQKNGISKLSAPELDNLLLGRPLAKGYAEKSSCKDGTTIQNYSTNNAKFGNITFDMNSKKGFIKKTLCQTIPDMFRKSVDKQPEHVDSAEKGGKRNRSDVGSDGESNERKRSRMDDVDRSKLEKKAGKENIDIYITDVKPAAQHCKKAANLPNTSPKNTEVEQLSSERPKLKEVEEETAVSPSTSDMSKSTFSNNTTKEARLLTQKLQRKVATYSNPDGRTYPGQPVQHKFDSSLLSDCEEFPLCTCRLQVEMPSISGHFLICQATDWIDEKTYPCGKKVMSKNWYRPSVNIPFMNLCEVHVRRLLQHQCCPKCGHFCSQGKFLACRQEQGSITHLFHAGCVETSAASILCPHCSVESSSIHEVCLSVKNLPVPPPSLLDPGPSFGVRAKMSLSRRELHSFADPESESDSVSLSVDDEVSLSSKLFPSDLRRQFENHMKIVKNEKYDKNVRVSAKSLYKACKSNDVEKFLLNVMKKQDVNYAYPEYKKQTPLHAAARSGALLCVQILLFMEADINAQDSDLKTPLVHAAEGKHFSVVAMLLKAGASPYILAEGGMSLLHIAAKVGEYETVRHILENKILPVNSKDDGGWTALVWACEYTYLKIVHTLIDSGANVNLTDNEGNTALHWAVYSGNVEISKLLLTHGTNINCINEVGDRPMHIAARQNRLECLLLLIQRGSESWMTNMRSETPLSTCEKGTDCHFYLNLLHSCLARSRVAKRRLVMCDLALGRENCLIPVFNGVDDETQVLNFKYIDKSIEGSPLNIKRDIGSLQNCLCKFKCKAGSCMCFTSSITCWYDEDGRLKDSFNMKDPPTLFECGPLCQCHVTCPNRVVQLGLQCRLQIVRTENRGWGVQSEVFIKKGTFVCEYTGELMSDLEAESREDDSYLFDLDNSDCDTYCIDAKFYGNVSRFINHLCEPNLATVKVFIEHQDTRFPRIAFFAARNILPNEELGFDYGEKFWRIKFKDFTCKCGSAKCCYSENSKIQVPKPKRKGKKVSL